MKYQPIFDRVIAKEIKESKKTKSGITLATEKKEDFLPKKAEVIATGRGAYEDGFFISMQVNVGDIILFEEHTAVKFYDENKEYFLIKQTDILAKTKGEN